MILKELLKKYGHNQVKVVRGGETRQASVFNALKACNAPDYAAIHDAARPLVKKEDIEKCEKNPDLRLVLNKNSEEFIRKSHEVKSRYTPMAHRQNRPDAIMWLIKNHPNISDAQICKLVRTTKSTINAIRERTHKSISEIQPRNPVLLGICSEFDLTKAILDADAKAERELKKAEALARKAEKKAKKTESDEEK